MSRDVSRITVNQSQNCSQRLAVNQTMMEDLKTDDLRAVGLGYNYVALRDEVTSLLTGTVQKVLPAFDDESRFIAGRTPTGRPRYSIDTTLSMQFDHALCDLASEKESAKEAVDKATSSCQNAVEMSRKVDLYILTLNTILAEIQSGPDPRAPPAKPVSQLAVPSRSGAKDTTAVRRQTSRLTQGTALNWKQAANNAISQNIKPKVTKAKGPPPKPVPRPVTEDEFASVSMLVRGRAKLADVNKAYDVLYDAFFNECLEKIKLKELVKRSIYVSGMTEMAKFKILRSLKRITLSADENYIYPADF